MYVFFVGVVLFPPFSHIFTHAFFSFCPLLCLQFNVHSLDIARAAQASARTKYEIAESFSLATTSLALDKGLEFPFVTMPDFEVQASNARDLAETEMMAWCPMVSRTQAPEWGRYVATNQGWLQESYEYLGLPFDGVGTVSPVITMTRDFDDPNYNEGSHPLLLNMMSPIWYVILGIGCKSVRSVLHYPGLC